MAWEALQAELEMRQHAGLARRRRVRGGAQLPWQVLDNEAVLSFCSNDYLGLAAHPDVRAAMAEGIASEGVGSGASHLINGHSRLHEGLETQLAAFCGRERALLFSTGYMANLGVLSALADRHSAIFLDKLCHASLLDGARLAGANRSRYPHNDWQALARLLQRNCASRKLIVTDGVFSMDGDMAPLTELARLAVEHGAWLMVDDAHGLGVLGSSGRGALEAHGLGQAQVPVLVGTLGKALGGFGAFVAGADTLIEYLTQTCRTYIYTTALPPGVAAGVSAALRIAEAQPWRRHKALQLAERFQRLAQPQGLPLLPSVSPIQALVLGSADRALAVEQHLRRRGIAVIAIRPPTVPAGTARLRITFSAAHEEADVDRLLAALVEVIEPLRADG